MNDSLTYHAANGNLETVNKLLENGADVNMRNVHNDEYDTPLTAGIMHKEIVETLIQHGADVNLPGDGGYTPIEILATSKNPDQDVINLLMEHGANLNLGKNMDDMDAKGLAERHENLEAFGIAHDPIHASYGEQYFHKHLDGAEKEFLMGGPFYISEPAQNIINESNLTPEFYLDVTERLNNIQEMLESRGASQHDFNNLTDIRANLDSAFDKAFEQVRDAAQKLENIPELDKEVKEITSTLLSFDANTTVNEVLNSFEKHAPHLVEEIRNAKSLDFNGTSIDLGYLDAKTVAEHLSDQTNGKVGIEFEQQEKSKGYER